MPQGAANIFNKRREKEATRNFEGRQNAERVVLAAILRRNQGRQVGGGGGETGGMNAENQSGSRHWAGVRRDEVCVHFRCRPRAPGGETEQSRGHRKLSAAGGFGCHLLRRWE